MFSARYRRPVGTLVQGGRPLDPSLASFFPSDGLCLFFCGCFVAFSSQCFELRALSFPFVTFFMALVSDTVVYSTNRVLARCCSFVKTISDEILPQVGGLFSRFIGMEAQQSLLASSRVTALPLTSLLPPPPLDRFDSLPLSLPPSLPPSLPIPASFENNDYTHNNEQTK